MTSFEIAHDQKTRGALVFQKRNVSGAWTNFLQVTVPKHLRYSAEVLGGTLHLYLFSQEIEFREDENWQLGRWMQVGDRDVSLGHHVGIKGARSVISTEAVDGPIWVREGDDGVPKEIRIGSNPPE